MTFGTSILPPGVWCTLAVELALLLFHVSVWILVGGKLLKRQTTFATAFFALYFLLSLADVGHYFSVGDYVVMHTATLTTLGPSNATRVALWCVQRLDAFSERV